MNAVKKTRKYSPVRIVNPVADNHSVHLHPNQGFLVLISAWMGLVDLDYNSEFFILNEEEELRDGTRLFHFAQKYDLTEWYQVGSAYLGEVQLMGANTCSSLCVSLHSEKTDLFTVINPFGIELKIHPHQVLEVVLYDKHFDGKWSCVPQPGDDGVAYKQVGYEAILTSVDVHSLIEKLKTYNNFMVFPRALDYEGKEHHYWFEYDVASLKQIAKWKTGTFHGGRLIFTPGISTTINPPERNILHINLSVRGKNRNKLDLPKRLPDSTSFDNGIDGMSLDDMTTLDDYPLQDDDVILGNCGATISGGYPQGNYYSGHKRQCNINTTPMVRNANIQEKIIQDSVDPLFQGATTVQHTESTYQSGQSHAIVGKNIHRGKAWR